MQRIDKKGNSWFRLIGVYLCCVNEYMIPLMQLLDVVTKEADDTYM